jgi:phosphohistidine phosphatase
MRLLFIRHAIAGDRDEWVKSGRPDSERPLTDRGRERMRRSARGLTRILPQPDMIATSPYLRAAETAAIVSSAFDGPPPVELTALVPGTEFADLVTWLRAQKVTGTVALVGHEPHLGGALCYFLTGRRENFFEFKKGGAALVQLADPPTPGVARLLWVLEPGQLRNIEE